MDLGQEEERMFLDARSKGQDKLKVDGQDHENCPLNGKSNQDLVQLVVAEVGESHSRPIKSNSKAESEEAAEEGELRDHRETNLGRVRGRLLG